MGTDPSGLQQSNESFIEEGLIYARTISSLSLNWIYRGELLERSLPTEPLHLSHFGTSGSLGQALLRLVNDDYGTHNTDVAIGVLVLRPRCNQARCV